jgi:hypothetical protein
VSRIHLTATLVLTSLVLLAPAARGSEAHSFTLAVMGGAGGFFDADPDGGLGNQALQVSLGVVVESDTLVVLRIGQLDQDPEGQFAALGGGTLAWVDVAGEYRLRQPIEDAGIYAGLGAYRFEGDAPGASDDTSIGAVIGLTGAFDLTPRWAILVDLSAHYADLEVAQTFGIATAGVAFSF